MENANTRHHLFEVVALTLYHDAWKVITELVITLFVNATWTGQRKTGAMAAGSRVSSGTFLVWAVAKDTATVFCNSVLHFASRAFSPVNHDRVNSPKGETLYVSDAFFMGASKLQPLSETN